MKNRILNVSVYQINKKFAGVYDTIYLEAQCSKESISVATHADAIMYTS